MKLKNIVILADAGLGDFVWATSALSLIRQYDKNIEIILVTDNKYVELTDSSLNINKIVTTNNKYHANKNKILRLCYKLFWSIKNFKNFYRKEACLILDISLFFTITAKYLYRIKNIIGPDNFSFGYDEKNKSAAFYTKKVKMQKNSDKTAYMMRYQNLVRAVFPTYNLSKPIIPSSKDLPSKTANLMEQTKKYKIAIAPCGSVSWRRFSTDFLKETILKTNEIYNATFFIFGNTKQEKEYANNLTNLLPDIDIRNFVGQTSLPELRQILKNMDLLLTVDTGIYHIAATTNIHIIAVHGATLPENSGAISSKAIQLCSYRDCSPCSFKTVTNNFVCKNPLCIKDITSEMVLKEIKEILK